MTKTEFKQIELSNGLYNALSELSNSSDLVTTTDTLKDFAIMQIKNDCEFLAIHILQALQEGSETDFWRYDYNMGTMETPTEISSYEDVEDLLED